MPVVLTVALGSGVHVLAEEFVAEPERVLTEAVRREALGAGGRLGVCQLRWWPEGRWL